MFLGDLLDCGHEGEVYDAVYMGCQGYCAKKVPENKKYTLEMSQYIYNLVNSEFFIPCYGILYNDGDPCLVMKRAAGTLVDFIENPSYFGLHYEDLDILLYQTALALKQLKDHNLYWGDLKLQNILVDSFVPRAYICDFGSAKFLNNCVVEEGDVFTELYKAPEVVKGAIVTPQADLFSFGVMIYIAKVMAPPFTVSDDFPQYDGSEEDCQLREEACMYKLNTERDKFKFLDCDCQELLINCLKVDPRERWTIEDVLNSRFFSCFKYQ
ncbi:CAMK family protein kinase [Trichomonas vaginalis G3]|uniref:CAMK family protein kinase n=1 Tax=Trichomonas vaginalis (strain ATCC PRA-98 / G3) TaxID=412133 RepID=A2F671_TRIV3|nr:protein kinase D signaling [Trichomonas vaginalis G3]EAX99588.1 CAMK family protein kinase [Trichomonas vaginalis G3]KAI5506461.1 protein kinase D signaling [Trichomonas vaginalis G3]|eukprot:XP_001312518.1 CAMK family protein kinase [Trichomonas vaginalis G3]